MRHSFRALLLICVLLHTGCSTPQQKHEPMVSVIDTIGGQEHIVSAKIGEDGKFNNSATEDRRTQTISGHVVKSEDMYRVTVDYTSTHDKVPGLRKINSTVNLRDGESQAIGGLGSEVVYLKISIE